MTRLVLVVATFEILCCIWPTRSVKGQQTATTQSESPSSNGSAPLDTADGTTLTSAEQIQALVTQLRQESTDQSLQKLNLVEPYYSSYAGSDAPVYLSFPIPSTADKEDILHIVSNRRFLKLLSDLPRLPKVEQTRKLSQACIEAQREFLVQFHEILAGSAKYIGAGTKFISGLPLTISDDADGTPAFAGARLRVLSTLLLIASVKCSDCKGAVMSIVNEAEHERAELSNPSLFSKEGGADMLSRFSIYNRRILLAAALNVQPITPSVSALLEKRSIKLLTISLPDFDVRATPFDFDVQRTRKEPASQGNNRMCISSEATDEDFDCILTGLSGGLSR